MQTSSFLLRSLSYYWRTNLAVVLGVATAVAVLAGALLVGDSVRASLRDMFLGRIGKTDHVVTGTGFFREQLAGDVQSSGGFEESFSGACPLISLTGLVTHEKSRQRASGVAVYGVDDRFWRFHGREAVEAPGERDVLMSPDLARELGGEPGDPILLRIEKPSAIPAESLHGRKEELGRTVRLTLRQTLPASAMGEFALRPQQGGVRAVFVSLKRLQKDLEQEGRANVILLAEKTPGRPAGSEFIEKSLRDTFTVEDLGIKLRPLDAGRGMSLESESAVISDSLYEGARAAASRAGLKAAPVLSYLANSIKAGEREVPYSLVTAVGPESFDALLRSSANQDSGAANSDLPAVVLNEWAASDLGARPGDVVTLEYYLWKEDGRLATEAARLRIAAVVPISGAAADRDLVPDYPGITETESLSDWDPPFPIELERVRPKDEDYWHNYKTTPKAFIPIEVGQRLWQSRYGKLTSVRIIAPDGREPAAYLGQYKQELRSAIDPLQAGLSVIGVRIEGLQASRGATDFGEYFVYFSFFIVVAALLLVSLFFKLGVEQRTREIGILQAVGFPPARVRSLFLKEGLALASLGSLLGLAGALLYGALVMFGLRTWWVGAVGTTALELHISPTSLALGVAGGVAASLLCIVWTLRALRRSSARSLLAGSMNDSLQRLGDEKSDGKHGLASGAASRRSSSSLVITAALALAGLLLLLAASFGMIGQTAGFFGAGTLILAALLCGQYAWLKAHARSVIQGAGLWPLSRMGFRNASHRPARSILCIALIAAAAFIIVAVDAFRRDGAGDTLDRRSGTGGFPLLAESLLPLYHDPNTDEGREALTLSAQKDFDPASVTFTKFRLRPGDDASCLNLYEPRNPRILGAGDEFLKAGRFPFQDSLARTDDEKQNPWLLLNQEPGDGAVPVAADANSMTYVLHRKLGDEIALGGDKGQPVRLRLVASLQDSIFQGELLMSERNFVRLFPERGGYSFFLLDCPPPDLPAVSGALEDQLSDFGFDAVSTAERLASFHRVENTYLSTFQTLGGLGLALGTVGLATVLLRNVLERRKELALLRAVGFNSRHMALMVITENLFLVCCGLATGALAALVAIAPAFFARGGHVSTASLGLMLLAVLVTGLLASVLATAAALRSPLIPALRAE